MENENVHIVGYDVIGKVLIALIVLLSVSVLAAWLNLGVWIIVIAMLISCIKASIVLTWFMHLKYDKLVFKLMAGLVLMVIVIIFVLLFFDYWFR
jgi:cytochrome c oxidase subunit IV